MSGRREVLQLYSKLDKRSEITDPVKLEQAMQLLFNPTAHPMALYFDNRLHFAYQVKVGGVFYAVDISNNLDRARALANGFSYNVYPTSDGGLSGREPSVKKGITEYLSTENRNSVPLFIDGGNRPEKERRPIGVTLLLQWENGIYAVTVFMKPQDATGSSAIPSSLEMSSKPIAVLGPKEAPLSLRPRVAAR